MMQKQVTTKNNEAGFMGLEGMGALLFYLVMLAGAALLIVQLFSGGKLSETEKALSSLRMGIQQLYTAQGNYGAADADITGTVADSGILPAGLECNDDKSIIISPWSTHVKVNAIDDGKQFAITIDVPVDDCVRLATYDMNAWLATYKGEPNAATTTTIDSVAAAQTMCKPDNATDENVKLTFTAK